MGVGLTCLPLWLPVVKAYARAKAILTLFVSIAIAGLAEMSAHVLLIIGLPPSLSA